MDDGRVRSSLQHIPTILNRVKVLTLWWPIHDVSCSPKHSNPNLILVNPGIVILEYACGIREEKNLLMK